MFGKQFLFFLGGGVTSLVFAQPLLPLPYSSHMFSDVCSVVFVLMYKPGNVCIMCNSCCLIKCIGKCKPYVKHEAHFT
jgi:hypothetical protein